MAFNPRRRTWASPAHKWVGAGEGRGHSTSSARAPCRPVKSSLSRTIRRSPTRHRCLQSKAQMTLSFQARKRAPQVGLQVMGLQFPFVTDFKAANMRGRGAWGQNASPSASNWELFGTLSLLLKMGRSVQHPYPGRNCRPHLG